MSRVNLYNIHTVFGVPLFLPKTDIEVSTDGLEIIEDFNNSLLYFKIRNWYFRTHY